MTTKQAIRKISQLGFKFRHGVWGCQPAEPYNVGKDHFNPLFRDVFIGTCVDGFYITSHIKGTMRHYRCRNSYETTIANIFGGGKTLAEAVKTFCNNFTTKAYNITK